MDNLLLQFFIVLCMVLMLFFIFSLDLLQVVFQVDHLSFHRHQFLSMGKKFLSPLLALDRQILLYTRQLGIIAPAKQDVAEFLFSTSILTIGTQSLQFRRIPVPSNQEPAKRSQRCFTL